MLMMAIPNSWGTKPNKPLQLRCKFNFLTVAKQCWALGWMVMLLGHLNARAESGSTPIESQASNLNFAQHAEKAFMAAKARFETETSNPEAKWQFARTCYDWADFATSDKQRADIAQQGITACRGLIERDPNSMPGHYYLALNLGQLAQTKSLGALKIVRQMEAEFKVSSGLDPQFDFAGSDRGLGLLYLDAPGWPTSIGNKAKARQHLQKALRLFPDFPENLLNFIEAEIKWSEKHDAIRDLATLDELWPAAQKKFAGDKWASSWADWAKRRGVAEEKVAGARKAPGSSR